jgi:hypothetical protein
MAGETRQLAEFATALRYEDVRAPVAASDHPLTRKIMELRT